MENGLKILLCHNFYQNIGGEDQAFWRQKELLESHGHQVICFTRDNQEIGKYHFFQKAGLAFSAFFSFDTYFKIKKIIRDEKPDIIHTHNIFPLISPSIYYAARYSRVPVIQTLHNYRLMCVNGLFLRNDGSICERCAKGNFFHAVIGQCYRQSYIQSLVMAAVSVYPPVIGTFRKIDFFISPSEFLKSKMNEHGADFKVVCIPNFVGDNAGPLSDASCENTICYFGRLSREKGLATLLKAVKGTAARLRIVGEGPLRQELEKIIAAEGLDNVVLTGFKSDRDLKKEIGKALAVVVPSEWYENNPLSVIEAFSSGRPVIGSAIGGIPELIQKGETGLTFEPGNAGDLREKIKSLLNNPALAARMGKTAREYARTHFSPARHYEELMRVYQKAAIKK